MHDDTPFGVTLHNNSKYSKLPLILLSRLSHRNQFHGGSNSVFSACLLKPVPVGRLHDSLCKIFTEKDVLHPSSYQTPTAPKPGLVVCTCTRFYWRYKVVMIRSALTFIRQRFLCRLSRTCWLWTIILSTRR
jgi:hypothetical protein